MFEHRAMSLIFYYLDLSRNKDVRLAFEATKVSEEDVWSHSSQSRAQYLVCTQILTFSLCVDYMISGSYQLAAYAET